MRPALIVAAIMGAWLLCAGSLRAGVYHPDPPKGKIIAGPGPNREGVIKPIPPEPFKSLLTGDLRKIPLANLPKNTWHDDYIEQRDKLREKERTGQLTERDRVNLSACLIRLGQYEDAVQLLTPVAGRECRDFMIKSNLGTANQLAAPSDPARLMRAAEHISDALDLWPAESLGFTAQQLAWLKEAEKAQRTLLRLRSRELRKQAAGAAQAAKSVDELFGPLGNPVRFVGENGEYEAGKLAAAEQAKLPPDATALVQQLLVWLPEDDRLYWLYGELLNAHGDVRSAYEVLDYCLDKRNYNVPELREHRRILQEAPPPPEAPPPAPPSLLPDRSKMLLVGGLGGLLIGAFVFLQVREMRRRRVGSSTASKGC